MSAYGEFAGVYDTFMEEVPYEEWADRFERFMDEAGFSGSGPTVVDLGCGTGKLTEILKARGRSILGIDLSGDMLTQAAARRDGLGSDTLYICQDMRELDLGMQAEVFISACDCVNYLQSPGDLTKMFRSVGRHLAPEGIFLFDFNTVHKYRDVIGDTTIAESREDCAFIWENYYDDEQHLNEYDLTLFIKTEGENFRRSVETHIQRGYTLEEMKAAAEAGGLEITFAMDADTEEEITEETERIFAKACRRP